MKHLYYITLITIAAMSAGAGALMAINIEMFIYPYIGFLIQVILAFIVASYCGSKGINYYGVFVLSFWIPIVGFIVAILSALFSEKK